ncbi:unnamed protein product [Diabrotica balteata]|uniref:Uncharacterized protein n=1 Tax=Diabrotica balteata TaxID=107213 RepID=A0A9N9XCH5_DIABA|nr:unnamed protein product [Diabrotica balteata]
MKVYKTTVRPILTYTAEARTNTTKTKQQINNIDMKVLRSIASISLRDRKTNRSIREHCKIQNINRCIKCKPNGFPNMVPDRLANICKNNKTYSRRLVERPPKRWKDNVQSTTTETK